MDFELKYVSTIGLTNELVESISEKIADTLNKSIHVSTHRYHPIAQFARKYGLTRRSLYNYHKKGILTLKKIEGKVYVDEEEFLSNMKTMEL